MADKKALKLLSMFALPPVILGRCGRDRNESLFLNCIEKGECEGVVEKFKTFFVLYPYVKTIAAVAKKEEFSYEVAEAYWLGSSLLEIFEPQHFEMLLNNLAKQGTPEEFLSEIRQSEVDEFIPTHLFQLLYVSSQGSFKMISENISQINECMIRPAKVVKVGKRTLRVRIPFLEAAGGQLVFGSGDIAVKYRASLLSNIKKGDNVAVHWGNAVKKTNAQETANLEHWNKKVVESFNRYLKKGHKTR